MRYSLSSYFKVKEAKAYPWPWAGDKSRMTTIYIDDVLTRREDGTFMRHTGLGIFGIQIPEGDLVPVDQPVMLVI